MKIDPTQLYSFPGGLRLDSHKRESVARPIGRAPIAPRLILPLQQHIGTPADPCVEPGEQVLKGQVLAYADGYVSAAVHAPTSGTIVEIADHAVPHPSGLAARCIVLEPDGQDRWLARPKPESDYTTLNPSALRNRIREAGIVGLGGAGFPSFIKLNPGTHHKVELLVLNGAECEPYISCDDMLMRERPDEIVRGLQIMRHALQAADCVIGIEDNKPEACAALRDAVAKIDPSIDVIQVRTRYPAGGEKQLIQVLTGREVPSQGLPLDVGVVCHNVATAASVYRALERAEPLISRIVTVTGAGVREPQNLEVLIGTPFRDVIEHCGGYTDDRKRLIMGGPMMGFALDTDTVPVIKTSNCIFVAGHAEAPEPQPALPCIRCSACADACPAQLLPQQLYWYSRAREFDRTQDYHLFDCIECGCCAYVCPSHIPLVQYFRFAKTEIWAQERDKRKADLARVRHELHLERIEQEMREKEQRMRKKKDALKSTEAAADSQDLKKAAIEAALQRAKAKQTQRPDAAHTGENLNAEPPAETSDVDVHRSGDSQPAADATKVDNNEQ